MFHTQLMLTLPLTDGEVNEAFEPLNKAILAWLQASAAM
jgi:hypothetical protein